MSKRKTTAEFISEAKIIHGELYDYSHVEYKSIHSKVNIICQQHGIFTQEPIGHLKGYGCSKCGNIKSSVVRLSRSSSDKKLSADKRKTTNIEKYGVEHPLQNKQIQEAKSATNIKKYGVPHPLQCEEVLEKLQQTNLKKYGVHSPSQNKEIDNKKKQTNLERYGTESPFGSLIIKDKIKQTNLKRYGVEHPAQNRAVVEKCLKTNKINHGGVHNTQTHMINILPLITDKDWLVDQYINENKTATEISIDLGIGDTAMGRYIHAHGIPIRYNYKSSGKSNSWLKFISETENVDIRQASVGGEYLIPGTKFKADGYCAETNTIYEFYGDYWHGNPKVYESEYWNKTLNTTMGELYQKTIERENKIKELGYNIVTMWESDWNNQLK